MNTLTPFRYSGAPLRAHLPVVSNREFIRAWMARRSAALKAAAVTAGTTGSPRKSVVSHCPLRRA